MRAEIPSWHKAIQSSRQLELRFPMSISPPEIRPGSIDDLAGDDFGTINPISTRYNMEDRSVLEENIRRTKIGIDSRLMSLNYWNQFFWAYSAVSPRTKNAVKELRQSGKISGQEYLSVFIALYLINVGEIQFYNRYARKKGYYKVTERMKFVFENKHSIREVLQVFGLPNGIFYLVNVGNYARGRKINQNILYSLWMRQNPEKQQVNFCVSPL